VIFYYFFNCRSQFLPAVLERQGQNVLQVNEKQTFTETFQKLFYLNRDDEYERNGKFQRELAIKIDNFNMSTGVKKSLNILFSSAQRFTDNSGGACNVIVSYETEFGEK
jgi:hypothetical protein